MFVLSYMLMRPDKVVCMELYAYATRQDYVFVQSYLLIRPDKFVCAELYANAT